MDITGGASHSCFYYIVYKSYYGSIVYLLQIILSYLLDIVKALRFVELLHGPCSIVCVVKPFYKIYYFFFRSYQGYDVLLGDQFKVVKSYDVKGIVDGYYHVVVIVVEQRYSNVLFS